MRKTCLLLSALAGLIVTSPGRAAELLSGSRNIQEVVDHYIDLPLKEQKVEPAPLADDATILRRVTLDLAGRIPTAAELQSYLASADPDKRTQLVDRLMASSGFVRHQINEIDTMLSAAAPVGSRRSDSMREYLTKAVKENRSWDRIFRELMLADESDPSRKGSTKFLQPRIKDLDRLTTEVSVVFFGVNISCAQCHDHPLVSDWKQAHYFGLKSFFARTYEAGAFLGERDTAVVEYKSRAGKTNIAKLMFLTSKTVDAPGAKPLTPDGLKKLRELEKKQKNNPKASKPPAAPKFSARAALVKLALEPDQRHFFAKSIVNRMWTRFFGLGLVTPGDQMHSENAASHPELLDWLARDTAEHGYDLRWLIRGLVLSKAYARSSRFDGDRRPAVRSFAIARLRPLTPMQLATSLRLATTAPDQFTGKLKPEEIERRLEGIENSARGWANLIEQPYDDFQISVTEALLFSNNDQIQRDLLADGRDRLVGYLLDKKTAGQSVDLAIQNVFTRTPTADEKKALVDYLAQRRDRPAEGYRQMIWALLTSAEFRFNY